MENLPLNIIDIGVLVVLLFGGLMGLALGFVRGGLFVFSWLGAGIITLIGLPTAQPYARQYIKEQFFADLAAGVAIFLVTLVVLFLASSVIGGWVRKSRLNALDRSLGMLAGLITSVLIIIGSYLVVENIWENEKDQPAMIKEAKSKPMIRLGAKFLNDVLPADFKVMTKKAADDVTNKAKQTTDSVGKSVFEKLVKPEIEKSKDEQRPGYDNKERGSLNNAIERLNQKK